MKQLGDMKLYNFEELLDEYFGKIGTLERDKFESTVDESVQAYKLSIDNRSQTPKGCKKIAGGVTPL